ncbi:hypothetical protein DNTS_003166 [Danionella cerebrum]|uniref:Uncharacterized protein n=1 Tax=Danionella cerebrum TaxID=2873325 RepID=A0A553N5W3_9TELE|nr:hypothetical protein DNTS_003166 [Danionella translucida]
MQLDGIPCGCVGVWCTRGLGKFCPNLHEQTALQQPGQLRVPHFGQQQEAVALFLVNQWYTLEDILRTSNPEREGLVEVRSVGERIVLYVLNRIIYRTVEKGSNDVPFLCHEEDEFAKILWKNGKAKAHRGNGHGLQMLEDYVDSFKDDELGLKYPLTTPMRKVCSQYLKRYPADVGLLWEVEGVGGPYQKEKVANKLATVMEYSWAPEKSTNGQVTEVEMTEEILDITADPDAVVPVAKEQANEGACDEEVCEPLTSEAPEEKILVAEVNGEMILEDSEKSPEPEADAELNQPEVEAVVQNGADEMMEVDLEAKEDLVETIGEPVELEDMEQIDQEKQEAEVEVEEKQEAGLTGENEAAANEEAVSVIKENVEKEAVPVVEEDTVPAMEEEVTHAALTLEEEAGPAAEDEAGPAAEDEAAAPPAAEDEAAQEAAAPPAAEEEAAAPPAAEEEAAAPPAAEDEAAAPPAAEDEATAPPAVEEEAASVEEERAAPAAVKEASPAMEEGAAPAVEAIKDSVLPPEAPVLQTEPMECVSSVQTSDRITLEEEIMMETNQGDNKETLKCETDGKREETTTTEDEDEKDKSAEDSPSGVRVLRRGICKPVPPTPKKTSIRLSKAVVVLEASEKFDDAKEEEEQLMSIEEKASTEEDEAIEHNSEEEPPVIDRRVLRRKTKIIQSTPTKAKRRSKN